MTSGNSIGRPTNSARRYLLCILVVSVLLRLAVAFYLGDSTPPGKDETSYSVLAWRLATGHGYSFPQGWYPFAQADVHTAHWSFLLVGAIAVVYSVAGFHPLAFRLFSAVSGGILLPWMAYRLSRRVLPERSDVALATAALSAAYAYFALYAAQLMTETFYIVTVLWLTERAYAVRDELRANRHPGLVLLLGFGVSLGLATLLRQAILPWIVVLFGLIALEAVRAGNWRAVLVSVGLPGVVLALHILPFSYLNFRAYDDFLLLNSNTGYAMYSAQHPMHGTEFQAFTAALLPTDIEPLPANEAQWDRALMRRGIQFILAEPGRYAMLSVSRLGDYFKFWPTDESSTLFNLGRALSFGVYLPFIAAGLWISRRYGQRLAWLYMFVALYSLLHVLTWAMIRYRLPVDAILLVFAGLAVVDAGRAVKVWRARDEVGLETH
jgi:hypothetical protein